MIKLGNAIEYYQMRLISFDIGIKTLSFAVFDTSASDPLCDWKTFNMCERVPVVCCHAECISVVKFSLNDRFFCKRHAKTQPRALMPGVRKSPTELSRMNSDALYIVARELECVPESKSQTKKALITAIRGHYDEYTLRNYVPPKASDMNLIEVGEVIKHHLDPMLPSTLKGTTAIIENQLGPTAVRMRCVQAMLTMHLLHRGCCDIKYISPRRKLENTETDQSSYAARKKSAREAIPSALCELNAGTHWLEFFKSHKKQDDLADAFLQGRWWLLQNKVVKNSNK